MPPGGRTIRSVDLFRAACLCLSDLVRRRECRTHLELRCRALSWKTSHHRRSENSQEHRESNNGILRTSDACPVVVRWFANICGTNVVADCRVPHGNRIDRRQVEIEPESLDRASTKSDFVITSKTRRELTGRGKVNAISDRRFGAMSLLSSSFLEPAQWGTLGIEFDSAAKLIDWNFAARQTS